jgi:ribonuclease P protein component
MLKKGLRLVKKEDFERVFRKGKPLFFGALACKITPNTYNHLRLGFSFGKKHVATAVGRNRLRRVISEAFSRHFAEGKVVMSMDIVFFLVKKSPHSQNIPVASAAQSVVEYINK